jgi:hypothetical protein
MSTCIPRPIILSRKKEVAGKEGPEENEETKPMTTVGTEELVRRQGHHLGKKSKFFFRKNTAPRKESITHDGSDCVDSIVPTSY